MTDKNLHSLGKINIPTPSVSSKEKAINMAMEEFKTSCEETEAMPYKNKIEKKQKNFQGLPDAGRLIDVLTNKLWETIMKKRIIQGLAFASVLVVAGLLYLDMPMTLGKKTEQGAVVERMAIRVAGERRGDIVSPPSRATFSSNSMKNNQDIPARPRKIASEIIDSIGKSGGIPVTEIIVARKDISPGEPLNNRNIEVYPWPKLLESPDFVNVEEGNIDKKLDNIVGKTTLERYVKGEPVRLSNLISQDKFDYTETNPIKLVSEEPVSTFSTDVDTSSYAFVRRQLNSGVLPQKDAVRIEEMINYFDYDYPLPEKAEAPFKPTVAVYPTPWNKNTKLIHIGIKGYNIIPNEKPSSNLVFLLDVSGSMEQQDKLPLLKNAFKMMVENLDPKDTVSIVTYAGRSATVLEPTKVAQKHKIITALENLNSGGSTAGAGGIKRAYELGEANFDKEGVNRVILATDGDFNVGITDTEELKGYIERKRDSGIFLSVLGFGQGNYNDALMQTLAQNGNGNAAYIDNLNEARKVLVEEASSTLFTIAKDVKIQVEFNPNAVSEYRLIGYETRMLKREDFNNDKVDAGDIGSGHTVTAIYEITPVGSPKMVDDLRYGKKEDVKQVDGGSEYGFLKMRYKLPNENTSKLISLPITKELEKISVDGASDDIRFAASVAGFAQLLRGGQYLKDFTYDDVIALASGAKGKDEFGYRAEFINLVRLAKASKAM